MLDVEPELGRLLEPAERQALAGLSVPVVEAGSRDLLAVLRAGEAFGAIVLDGIVLHELRLSDQEGLRLLGPGEIVHLPAHGLSTLEVSGGYRALPPTTLALLGNEFLLAATRYPQLVVGLQRVNAAQQERLAAHVAICRMPRVADRLLAMLWLLADTWGRVTPAGTTLPLALTHELLGALVGARRPTVTLAMGELAGRGAVISLDRGWLLLDAPPQSEPPRSSAEDPSILAPPAEGWSSPSHPRRGTDRIPEALTELRETISPRVGAATLGGSKRSQTPG